MPEHDDHDASAGGKLDEIVFIDWYCFIPAGNCSRCCFPGPSVRPHVKTVITAPAVVARAVSGTQAA